MFADPQLSSLSSLSSSRTAGALLSTTLSSTTVSRGDAGLALQDHRGLATSFPLNVSELNAVSEHIEEVETTHIPVETPSVNPSSQGFTPYGINSVSLGLSTANQLGQTASSSVSQMSFTNPFTVGSFLRPPPPPCQTLVWRVQALSFLLQLGPQVGLFLRFFRHFLSTHRLRQWDQVELSPFWLLDKLDR